MSDLQCAATFLLVRPTDSGPGGGAQPDAGDAALAARLTARRVAAVLADGDQESARTAEALADHLGLPVRQWHPPGPSEEPAADAEAAVERWRAALTDIADVHRGETVVIVTSARELAPALPWLAADAPADLADHPLPEAGMAEILVDADGWSLRAWPGVRGGP